MPPYEPTLHPDHLLNIMANFLLNGTNSLSKRTEKHFSTGPPRTLHEWKGKKCLVS